jgi:predicted TIM-barrel fold metal-dependent hydrolase
LIDDHAHPFPTSFVPLDVDAITLDVETDAGAALRRRQLGPGRLFAELFTAAIGRYLGVEAEEAVAARNEAAAADWSGHVQSLFADAGIEGMIIDEGVGTAEEGSLEQYQETAGIPMTWLARIDPLIDRAIGEGATALEIVEAVSAFMADAAARGAAGFKTVLAYRTGLGVDPGADLEAADASLRQDVIVRRRGKALRDLVMRRFLGVAYELGRPVQIHTGLGDSEIRLAESHPLLLEELLRTPEGSAAAIVLIHGSHPWPEEAAYLAATRPNLYVELSLSNLFVPLNVADRLGRLLDMAPREKLLMGSDGHGSPETHWFACRLLTKAFSQVGEQLVAAGARASWVEQTRQGIFADNARRLYALSF